MRLGTGSNTDLPRVEHPVLSAFFVQPWQKAHDGPSGKPGRANASRHTSLRIKPESVVSNQTGVETFESPTRARHVWIQGSCVLAHKLRAGDEKCCVKCDRDECTLVL